MVDTLVKIAVGLALENAIYNGQEIQYLTSLYSDPDMERAARARARMTILRGKPLSSSSWVWT